MLARKELQTASVVVCFVQDLPHWELICKLIPTHFYVSIVHSASGQEERTVSQKFLLTFMAIVSCPPSSIILMGHLGQKRKKVPKLATNHITPTFIHHRHAEVTRTTLQGNKSATKLALSSPVTSGCRRLNRQAFNSHTFIYIETYWAWQWFVSHPTQTLLNLILTLTNTFHADRLCTKPFSSILVPWCPMQSLTQSTHLWLSSTHTTYHIPQFSQVRVGERVWHTPHYPPLIHYYNLTISPYHALLVSSRGSFSLHNLVLARPIINPS